MKPTKEELEQRKLELQKQHDNLLIKINQGKEAIRSMEASLLGLQGAIQQCDWTLEQYKKMGGMKTNPKDR